MDDMFEEIRAFDEIVRRYRVIRTTLRATLASTRALTGQIRCLAGKSKSEQPEPPLLKMAEALIACHKAAKVDDDGYTLDLIEDALSHVGKRLAKECPHRPLDHMARAFNL